jgi:hypothetical protein
MARRLLAMILDRSPPDSEVVLGIDDTIERRWGAKTKARGISIAMRCARPMSISSRRAAQMAVARGGGSATADDASGGRALP